MDDPTINPPPHRYRRNEASRYLKNHWGIDRAPSTLAKLASVGGGPRFEHAGRAPLYPQPELDAFALGLLSPLKTSTSDKRRASSPTGVVKISD